MGSLGSLDGDSLAFDHEWWMFTCCDLSEIISWEQNGQHIISNYIRVEVGIFGISMDFTSISPFWMGLVWYRGVLEHQGYFHKLIYSRNTWYETRQMRSSDTPAYTWPPKKNKHQAKSAPMYKYTKNIGSPHCNIWGTGSPWKIVANLCLTARIVIVWDINGALLFPSYHREKSGGTR